MAVDVKDEQVTVKVDPGPSFCGSRGMRPGGSRSARCGADWRVGRRSRSRHLGVDETAITKGHRYLTIVADLDRQRALFLNDERTTESRDAFWPTCTPAAA